MNIASKLPKVKTSIFTCISALAKKYNAINLSQGFPDFESDARLTSLVTEAMQGDFNQYAPMQGVLSLRAQIAEKFARLYQTSYHPETEITITSGATQAIYTAIAACIEKDDEVLIFKPAYDCYEPAIELHKGVPIFVQLEGPTYAVDWAKVVRLVTPRTKMIIINTPHNPTGTIWNDQDFLALEKIVKDTNILILSDEVYEHIVFDSKKHSSACSFPYLKERSFIVASFGKTFHNTGWKIGYCVAPSALMHEFRKVHQFNVFCVNHPLQIALTTYLKDENTYLSLPLFYQEKRQIFLKGLEGGRFKWLPSQGTYFQLLDFSAISTESDVQFAHYLIKEHGMASIPISGFNTNNLDARVLRFCFAKKQETLEKATEILRSI